MLEMIDSVLSSIPTCSEVSQTHVLLPRVMLGVQCERKRIFFFLLFLFPPPPHTSPHIEPWCEKALWKFPGVIVIA